MNAPIAFNDNTSETILEDSKPTISSVRARTKPGVRKEVSKPVQITKISEIFACADCPRKYDRFDSFRSHCIRTHGRKVQRDTYNSSKQTKPKKPVMVSSSVEESLIFLNCDKCDKEFSTVHFLKKHKLTHSNAFLVCSNCGQVFKEIGLLKKHLEEKECQDVNNDALEERYIQVSRKRTRETMENGEKSSSTQNIEVSTAPLIKKIDIKIEPQPDILVPQIVVDDAFAVDLKTVKMEVLESVSEPTFTPAKPVRTTSLSNRIQLNDLVNSKSNTSESCLVSNHNDSFGFDSNSPLPAIPSSPSVSSGFTSNSQRLPLNNTPNLNDSIVSSNIEKNPLPLTAGIFTRTVQFPNELMVVWSYSLEDDLLSAVSMNKRNSILCVQELETLNLPKLQRDLLSKSQMVTFNLLDSNETFTLWTVIYFGEENCPTGLKKKLFRSFVDVEKTLTEHATSRGMVINNVMRYSEDGLFPLLSKNLNQKCMAFNFNA